MPKLAKKLSDIEVKRLRYNGKGWRSVHSVGAAPGLNLQVLASGERSWILRYADGTKRKELPLGGYPDVSLRNARERAFAERGRIRAGADPVAEISAKRIEKEEREREEAATHANILTFADAVDQFLDWKLEEFANDKHRKQWISTLDTYAGPVIRHKPVQDIAVADMVAILRPIWTTKTETASRLRGRIEAVLSWAIVSDHRTGPNPAIWRGNLDAILPKPTKVTQVTNQPAIGVDEFSDWFAALRLRQGMSARALEFLTLTASRSGEVRGATWSEIDMTKGVWIIPAARMKMRREHRVPLSGPALRMLRTLPRMKRDTNDPRPDAVFWAPRGGQLSDMALSTAMRRLHNAETDKGGTGWLDPVSARPAVPHGLRSSFRDWAAEKTDYAPAMAELALAHRVGGAVELAYRRGDMMEKRRAMMDDWAIFIGAEMGALAVVEG